MLEFLPIGSAESDNRHDLMFLVASLPLLESILDIATISFVAIILLLSLLSLSFIFFLRLKSRTARYLHNFNSLWPVRFLLVTFIALWACNELLRLPLFHRRYLQHFFSSLTREQKADFCKTHVVLSLGFFEPGFLVALIVLVNASINEIGRKINRWAVFYVFVACAPIIFLQIVFLFIWPRKIPLPEILLHSSIIRKDSALCVYPLSSTLIFTAFATTYCCGFLFSSWRVASVAINKGLRVRIHALALAVLIPLPLQIVSLTLSVFWRPDQSVYTVVSFLGFLSALSCAAVGESLLVISPIVEALAAGKDEYRCNAGDICRL